MKAEKLIKNHDAQISAANGNGYSTAVAERPHLAGPHLPGPDDEPSVLPPPKWYEIRGHKVTTARATKPATVAAAGGESLRWNVNPIPLLALIVSALAVMIILATALWNLSAKLATTELRLASVEIQLKGAQTELIRVANITDTNNAFYTQVKGWQDKYDGEQRAAKSDQLDQMFKLLKGRKK